MSYKQDDINFANLISQSSTLNSLQFQHFIIQPQIIFHKKLISVIADLITSGNAHAENQKKIVIISLQVIFKKRVLQEIKNYQICWEQYVQYFLTNPQIQFHYLMLTINALRYLLLEMQQNVIIMVLQKFSRLPFYSQLLMYEAIKDHQNISIENQSVFFRQTIEQFLQNGERFIKCLHYESNQITQELLKIQEHFIMNLYDWWLFEKEQQQQNKIRLQILAKQKILYEIMAELVIHTLVGNNNTNLNNNNETKQQKIKNSTINFIQMNDKNCNNNNKIPQNLLQIQNSIKSYSYLLLDLIIYSFPLTSDINSFDNIEILGMFQNLVIFLLKQLKSIADENKLKKFRLQDKKQVISLIIAGLSLIHRATRFCFFMQVFESCKNQILYGIIPYFIKIDQAQLQAFEQDQQQFISINENFIEQGNITYNPLTMKQAAGLILEGFFLLLNGYYFNYIETLGDCFKIQITNQRNQQLQQFFNKNNFKMPSVQVIFCIVNRSLLQLINKINGIQQFFYQKFVQPSYVFSLSKPLDKARFLIFLAYFYSYFENNLEQGNKYLQYAFSIRQEHQSIFAGFILLMQSSIHCGIGSNLWEYLTNNIKQTQRHKQIQLIRTVVQLKINQLNKDLIIDLLNKLQFRIKQQYQNCFNNIQGSGSQILYKCLHIFEVISSSYKNLSQQPQIICVYFKLIQTFLGNLSTLSRIQFDKQLIKIFNSILYSYKDEIPQNYYKILPILNLLINKNKQMKQIIETYYGILFKGKNLFYLQRQQRLKHQNNRNNQYLKQIKCDLQSYVLDRFNRTSSLLVIQSLFLLQNILLVYGQLVEDNKDVYQECKQIYFTQKYKLKCNQKRNQQLIASLILYFISRQCAFGNRQDTYQIFNQQPPNINELCQIIGDNNIQIYKQQFGQMFALNLNKLMQKIVYMNNNNNNTSTNNNNQPNKQIQFLLKCSFRLLEYKYSKKCQQQKNIQQNRNNKDNPPIKIKQKNHLLKVFRPELLMLDQFQQISNMINFLKENLKYEEFNYYVQILKNQFNIGLLNKLLKIRVLDGVKHREILVVKK